MAKKIIFFMVSLYCVNGLNVFISLVMFFALQTSFSFEEYFFRSSCSFTDII